MESTIAARCQQEVVGLHRFFQDWFNGEIAKTAAHFARFSEVLGDGFVIVSPDGRITERPALLTGLEAGHGVWRTQSNGRIWIENFHLRQQRRPLVLATYEEWQAIGDDVTVRLSTVFFTEQAGLPNGVAWLHVHETWLPQPS